MERTIVYVPNLIHQLPSLESLQFRIAPLTTHIAKRLLRGFAAKRARFLPNLKYVHIVEYHRDLIGLIHEVCVSIGHGGTSRVNPGTWYDDCKRARPYLVEDEVRMGVRMGVPLARMTFRCRRRTPRVMIALSSQTEAVGRRILPTTEVGIISAKLLVFLVNC
jgi:hypothetical protein